MKQSRLNRCPAWPAMSDRLSFPMLSNYLWRRAKGQTCVCILDQSYKAPLSLFQIGGVPAVIWHENHFLSIFTWFSLNFLLMNKHENKYSIASKLDTYNCWWLNHIWEAMCKLGALYLYTLDKPCCVIRGHQQHHLVTALRPFVQKNKKRKIIRNRCLNFTAIVASQCFVVILWTGEVQTW